MTLFLPIGLPRGSRSPPSTAPVRLQAPQHDIHRTGTAHECIGYRSLTTGTLYQWEFERKGRELQVAVRGSIVCSDARLMVRSAVAGLGLAYVNEQAVAAEIAAGRLHLVLGDYAPEVPGFFLYFPSRAQKLPKLRALIDAVRSEAAPLSP